MFGMNLSAQTLSGEIILSNDIVLLGLIKLNISSISDLFLFFVFLFLFQSEIPHTIEIKCFIVETISFLTF